VKTDVRILDSVNPARGMVTRVDCVRGSSSKLP
jgi:hypothetical protein